MSSRPGAFTVTMSSEYSSTAAVVSLYDGRVTPTSACIHGGASAAPAGAAAPSAPAPATMKPSAVRERGSVRARGRSHDDDLLLILAPHGLEEAVHRVVKLHRYERALNGKLPGLVQTRIRVLVGHAVDESLEVDGLPRRRAGHREARWQRDRDVIVLPVRVAEVDRMDALGVREHVPAGPGEHRRRHQPAAA